MKLGKILLTILIIVEIALLACAGFLYGYPCPYSEEHTYLEPKSGPVTITKIVYVYPYREISYKIFVVFCFLLAMCGLIWIFES
ncbi:MAG: hypothetical protein QW667_01990 [Candidatus Bathyarchaeia archaeon]